MKTMYAMTYKPSDGTLERIRTLVFANQGRNHFETREEAEEALDSLKESLRDKIMGDDADTLEVRPVTCYDHGDAVDIYFDDLPGLEELARHAYYQAAMVRLQRVRKMREEKEKT